MNKVKSFFGTSMVMIMISGLTLGLTACADQTPLGPSSVELQPSTYVENKVADEEVPAVDMEAFLRLGTDYDEDPE